MIESIDRNIGKVLDELKRSGLMENTIIIFASDTANYWEIMDCG